MHARHFHYVLMDTERLIKELREDIVLMLALCEKSTSADSEDVDPKYLQTRTAMPKTYQH